MKVGVIGSGEVGKALAKGFQSRGHDVTIGSRDPSKLADFVGKQNGRVRAGTFEETSRFGEIIVLATSFEGAKSAIDIAGPQHFDGKIVIDVTNPLKFEEGRMPQLSIGFETSAGEEVQRWLPGAKVVKAFNIVGHAHMFDPQFAGGPPTMFIAGNDEDAKRTVAAMIESFGWSGEVIDIGAMEEARLLEPLAMLWIHFGMKYGMWNHAFKLLRA
jgi:8-hydroxy-5-deazaflavin:NADPH oxidoreductase